MYPADHRAEYGGWHSILFLRPEPVLLCWAAVVALVLCRRPAAAAWAATAVTAAQLALLGWHLWDDGPHGGDTGKVAAWLATALVATVALHGTARTAAARPAVRALAVLGPVGTALALVVVPLGLLAHRPYYVEDVVLPVDREAVLDRPLPLVPDGRLLVPVAVLVAVVARRAGTALVLRVLAVLTPLLAVLIGDGPDGVPGGDTSGRLVPLGLRWIVAPVLLVGLFVLLAHFRDRRHPTVGQ